MLKIANIKQSVFEKILINTEGYPMSIELGEVTINGYLRWNPLNITKAYPQHELGYSIGSSNHQLMYIFFGDRAKTIHSIDLCCFDKYVKHDEVVLYKNVKTCEGAPAVDISTWPKRREWSEELESYTHENVDFTVYVGASSIAIDWSDINNTVAQVVAGRVRFGLDSNDNLSSLEVVDFKKEEIDLFLKEADIRAATRGTSARHRKKL